MLFTKLLYIYILYFSFLINIKM